MASKVTLENLGSEIQKILKDYENDVLDNMDVITKKVGQKGAKILRDESLAKFPSSGMHKQRYGETWTYKADHKRLYTTVTIYNRQAGLPHLLEHGHVSANGTGRNYQTDKAPVAGREHIAKVEKELVQQYEREVIQKL